LKAVRSFICISLLIGLSGGLLAGFAQNTTPRSGFPIVTLISGSIAGLVGTETLRNRPAGQRQVIKVDVDLVNIYVTVCNKHGRLIQNLDRANFAVYEDNNPQVITNFSRETDLPLKLVLLIDTSGSVRYKLSFEQDVSVAFLNSTLRPGVDQASVVTFDSSIDVRQNYTDDLQSLTGAVRHTRSGGATRLYDALSFLIKGTLAEGDGRRAIILLTDGDDNVSRSSPAEVVEAAQRNNVSIYIVSVNSIGIPSDESNRLDTTLEVFGTETGGKAFFPKKLKDLSSHLAAISKELRSQYTIAYRSTNDKRDGSYRKVRVEVKNTQYSVRARSGYYARGIPGTHPEF
jgi:Ca-activated chloride channel homolog